MAVQQDRPPLLTLTDAGATQIRTMIDQRGKPTLGIRIGIKTKGCNGLSYTLEYADTENPFDEMVETHDLKIFIDPKAVMFLIGTTMDYVVEDLNAGFTFKNPNEKGRCGCGESFHV